MTRKKILVISIAGLIALWMVANILLQFAPATRTIALPDSTATTGGSYGFSTLPSFGAPTLERGNGSDIAPVQQTPAVDSGRNIIQTAAISIVVDNVESFAADIEQMAKDAGGFVASASLGSYNTNKQITSGTMQVRIPQDKLNTFLETLRNDAIQVKNISTTSDDVTTQVRDLQAEIDNLTKQEEQLRAFFARTSNITQLLEVERELNRVRTQIDQKKGQLSYYERASALATVTINLALDESQLPASPSERFQPQAVWNMAVASLLGMLQNLAYLAIYIAVFSVIWIPLAIIALIIKKRYDKKRT